MGWGTPQNKERLQLESDVCDLDRKIAEESILLKQKELALKYSDDNVETARERYLLHQKNHWHMRKKADVVDIKEFRGTIQLLKAAKDEYNDNMKRNSELRGGAAHYRTSIAETTRRRDVLRARLDSFGEVLQFRKPQ